MEYCDRYVRQLRLDHVVLLSQAHTGEKLRGYDCAVIVTDHKNIDHHPIARESALVVHCSNAICTKGPNIVKL